MTHDKTRKYFLSQLFVQSRFRNKLSDNAENEKNELKIFKDIANFHNLK